MAGVAGAAHDFQPGRGPDEGGHPFGVRAVVMVQFSRQQEHRQPSLAELPEPAP